MPLPMHHLINQTVTMINGHQYEGPGTAMTFRGRPRTWGLRLSGLDCVVIVLALGGTILLWQQTAGLSLIGGLVVGHFFLFCNVFRIPRKPELVWGGLFLIICFVAYLLDAFSPIMLSALIAPVTLVTLIYAIRLPTYHGIFAKRLNPRLDDYLTGKTEGN